MTLNRRAWAQHLGTRHIEVSRRGNAVYAECGAVVALWAHDGADERAGSCDNCRIAKRRRLNLDRASRAAHA